MQPACRSIRAPVPRDVVNEPRECGMRKLELLSLHQQERRRLGTVHPGRDVGDVAAVALCKPKTGKLRPDARLQQLIAKRHPGHMNQVGVVRRRRLAKLKKWLDITECRMPPQNLGSRPPHERI